MTSQPETTAIEEFTKDARELSDIYAEKREILTKQAISRTKWNRGLHLASANAFDRESSPGAPPGRSRLPAARGEQARAKADHDVPALVSEGHRRHRDEDTVGQQGHQRVVRGRHGRFQLRHAPTPPPDAGSPRDAR